MVSSATAPGRRLLPVALATALVASLALTAPAAAVDPPSRQPSHAGVQVADEPFRLNLYRAGDFVSQTNLVQCVGASMQMMINMMRPADDRSAAWQLELQTLARRLSPRFGGGAPVGEVRERRGASSRGWAAGLRTLGFGTWHVTSAATLEEAVATAAVAMRRTGRPVGLLVWHGAHAWVMSGFDAAADPIAVDAPRVTHVYVQDPLYPRTSSRWGGSPSPNTRLSLRQLASDFVPWRPGRSSEMSGRFVIVLPYPESPTIARRV